MHLTRQDIKIEHIETWGAWLQIGAAEIGDEIMGNVGANFQSPVTNAGRMWVRRRLAPEGLRSRKSRKTSNGKR